MNKNQILKDSIKEFNEIKNPQLLNYVLIISFHNEKLIKEFKEIISDYIKDIEINNNFLTKKINSKEESLKYKRDIEKILSIYNKKILSTKFNENWLKEFILIKDYGVDYIHNEILRENQTIETIIEEKSHSKDETTKYKKNKRKLTKKAMFYKDEDFLSDWLDFLSKNFDFNNDEKLKEKLKEVLSFIKTNINNSSLITKSSTQTYLYDIQDKIKTMNIKNKEKIENIFDKMIYYKNDKSKSYNDWKEISKGISKIFKKSFNNIEKTNMNETENKFNGFNEDGYYENDINLRLTYNELKYAEREQGKDIIELISDALSANYLRLLETRKEELFRKDLLNISAKLNTLTIKDVENIYTKYIKEKNEIQNEISIQN